MKKSINLNLKEELFLIIGLFISALVLITIRNAKKFRSIFLTLLVCPYLIGSCVVQSGLLTDRSRNLRETIEYILAKEGLSNHSINVIKDNINFDDSTSNLIKISLMTPKLGKKLNSINELKPNDYAWMIESDNIDNIDNIGENYQIIASDHILNPWQLIKKKNI